MGGFEALLWPGGWEKAGARFELGGAELWPFLTGTIVFGMAAGFPSSPLLLDLACSGWVLLVWVMCDSSSFEPSSSSSSSQSSSLASSTSASKSATARQFGQRNWGQVF